MMQSLNVFCLDCDNLNIPDGIFKGISKNKVILTNDITQAKIFKTSNALNKAEAQIKNLLPNASITFRNY